MANSKIFNNDKKELEKYLKELPTEDKESLYKHYSKISFHLSKLKREMMFDFDMCQIDKVIIQDMLRTYKGLTKTLEKVMRYED